METARGFDMQSLPIVKALFWAAEMSCEPRTAPATRWASGGNKGARLGLLAEQPGRLIICGAACQPWSADVSFHLSTRPISRRMRSRTGRGSPGRSRRRTGSDGDPYAQDEGRCDRWTRADAIPPLSALARASASSPFASPTPAIRRAAERRWAAGRSKLMPRPPGALRPIATARGPRIGNVITLMPQERKHPCDLTRT